MNALDEYLIVASPKTPHRRFSAVAAFFDAQESEPRYWLADPRGGGVELPAELWGLLRDAALALAEDRGISMGLVPATLGLQEAAEFASVPLPTLLQCVSEGSIPLSENLVGTVETDTVALKDVVKLRQGLHRQREVAETASSFSSRAPQGTDTSSWSTPAHQLEPVSVQVAYPEPTIGPPPISVNPYAPQVSASPMAMSPQYQDADWQEFEATAHETAPVSPVIGHNYAAAPAPVRARAIARAAVPVPSPAPSPVSAPAVPSPVSAPAVQWTAGWSEDSLRPELAGVVEAKNVRAVSAPVSVPKTWFAAHRS